jgi:hypothetical protein
LIRIDWNARPTSVTLDLSHHPLGDLLLSALLEALADTADHRVERLVLVNCGLGPDGAILAAQRVIYGMPLRLLDLGRNAVGAAGVNALGECVFFFFFFFFFFFCVCVRMCVCVCVCARVCACMVADTPPNLLSLCQRLRRRRRRL